MFIRLFVAALVAVSTSVAAQAETIADQVVAQLSEQGFTRIEIRNGADAVTVAAVRDGQQLDVVYDAQTGAIINQSTSAATQTAPGVFIHDAAPVNTAFVAPRRNSEGSRTPGNAAINPAGTVLEGSDDFEGADHLPGDDGLPEGGDGAVSFLNDDL